MIWLRGYPLYISQLSHTIKTVSSPLSSVTFWASAARPQMNGSAQKPKRAWTPKGLAGPAGPAVVAATPAAAPPNPAGSWRAGRTGLVFASVSDRDRYERVRSDGDRSGGEDRSDGVRSGGGPHYAHSEGDGLEASGHVQSYRRVSFADQLEEQGSPGRGPLERGAPAVAGGAGGTHGQSSCAPSYFGLEDQGLGCTPAPRSGGTLNPTRSLSRGRPGDIGAHPEEWGMGSVRPMPGLGGPEGRDLRMAAPPHALGRRRASGEHPFRGQ